MKLFPPETSILGTSILCIALGFYIAMWFVKLTNSRVNKRIYTAMQTAPSRAGTTDLRLDTGGIHLSRPGMTESLTWPLIVDVNDYPGVTLLKTSPYDYYPIPHASLPPGLTPEALHTQIATWRAAAT